MHRSVRLTILILLISCTLDSFSEGIVTLEMSSKVALLDTKVTFICAGYGTAKIRFDIPNYEPFIALWEQMPIDYPEYGINITNESDQVDGQNIKTITTTIFSKATNNETLLKCTFADAEHENTKATLYIAKDELGEAKEFQNPTATNVDITTITISWSPPWSHAVNYYTITVNNMTTNDWTVHQLSDGREQWNITNTDTAACHDIAVFITAYTDVGSTSSNVLVIGFPIELTVLEESDMGISFYRSLDMSLRTELNVEVPSYCIEYQQQILYSYSMYDVNQEKLIKQFGPLQEPRLIINGLLEEVGYYRVIVNYWDANLPFQNVTVEKHFYTNFSSSIVNQPDKATTTIVNDMQDICGSSTQSTNTSSTDTPDQNCVTGNIYQTITDNNLVYGIIAFGAAMFVLLVISLIVIVVLIKLRRRVPTKTQDVIEVQSIPTALSNRDRARSIPSTTIKPCKKERKTSVPQMMATNPLYEGTGALYAYLPDTGDLKVLAEHPSEPNGDAINMTLVIPPQLPPPRKASLDSPGIKSGLQLSLDKRDCLGIEETDDTNDQYVQMSSTRSDQRYSKTPVLKLKLEESCFQAKRHQAKGTNIVDNKEQCDYEKI